MTDQPPQRLKGQMDVYDVLTDVSRNGVVPGKPERRPQSEVPPRLSVKELVAQRLREMRND